MILIDGQRSWTAWASFRSVHAAGHLDVGKQQFDIGARFEDRERIVGIDGFNGGEAGVLDHIHRAHAQQHLVFDHKNGGKNGGLTLQAMVPGTFIWSQ